MNYPLHRVPLLAAVICASALTLAAQTDPAARERNIVTPSAAQRTVAAERTAPDAAEQPAAQEEAAASEQRPDLRTPPPSPTRPTPVPPTRVEPSAALAPTAPADLVAAEPDRMIETLVLSDDSALQVLDLLEQMTGKIILRRQDISPVRINFNSRGPISNADAVLALESLLTLNGIMLTDMGGRFMKAVPATDVNRHVPEMIVGTTLDRPSSQQIYAKLFQLEYLSAEQALGTVITPLLSQHSGAVAFPKSNAILITDALINLQRVEKIIKEADRPQAIREEIHFVKLNFVQAREMQERLNALIQGPLNRYLEGSTSVSADERSNQLIVISHAKNFETIMRVIESVDVDAAPLTASEVFPLRQAKAEEVVPMIESIISGQKAGREADAKVARESASADRRGPQPAPPANGAPAEVLPQAPEPTTTVTGGMEISSSLQFSNFVGLSADQRTNAIVAYGTKNDLRTLGELIDKIDIPLPQVIIEAIITEVSLTENQASGLTSFGFRYDGANRTFSGIDVIAPGVGITGGELDLDNLSNFSLNFLIQAAESDNNIRILSTPRIVVSHNEEGIINVSQSRPIVTSSTSSLDNITNTRSTVEFRDIGIQLTVTPLIGADGTVQMKVEQRVENVVDTTTIDGNTQPIIGKREATSTISVRDRQVIVLGGLQENSAAITNNYWPIFGRLPLLNKVFGPNERELRRTELIIFIRPTVLENPAIANNASLEYIRAAREREAVEHFIETGSTGNYYLEKSKAKPEPTATDPETGPDTGIESGTPRSLRRLR